MPRGGSRPNSGGKRPGAGRKKGAATKKTRAVANAAAADGGVLPLQVLLEAMRAHHTAKRLDEAAKIAAVAAPYMHARQSAITVKGDARAPIAFIEVRRAPAAGGGSDPP